MKDHNWYPQSGDNCWSCVPDTSQHLLTGRPQDQHLRLLNALQRTPGVIGDLARSAVKKARGFSIVYIWNESRIKEHGISMHIIAPTEDLEVIHVEAATREDAFSALLDAANARFG